MRNSRKGDLLVETSNIQSQVTFKKGNLSDSTSEDQHCLISCVSINSEALSVDFNGQPTSNNNEASWDNSERPSIEQPPPIPLYTWDQPSPMSQSPWSSHVTSNNGNYSYTGLMGSLVREDGHVYSLATSGDMLYTGSDSKNIRVWKSQKEFSGFKSNSGLVKAIVIAGEKIFTGHQDGKIRVWKVSAKNPSVHKRIGTLPTLKAYIKCSFNPSNYFEVSRSHNALWIKHIDAISCLSLSEDNCFLYSASWDKTIKVWRVSDSKCLESILAHDDAVNSVVAGFDGLVFSGSADGTVKVWRRELQGKGTKHFFSQTLLKQECAVTALQVNPSAKTLYCGSSDGLVNFWERDKLLSHGGTLRGHKLAVLCLTTAGKLVFSGSADTNICVWRKEEDDHVCLALLSGHTGPVKCLSVQQERRPRCRNRQWVVYSGSLDKSVKIWKVSEEMTSVPSQQYNTEEYLLPQSFPSRHSFSSQGSRKSERRKC